MRRLASGAGVLALVAAGLIGGASMASAAGVAPGNPEAPETGSLTVHKYAGSETTDVAHNGTKQDVTRPPLGGVEFTVTPVGQLDGGVCVPLDLTTAAGWTAAQGVNQNAASADPYCLVTDDAESAVTDAATGEAVFAGLPLGFYYVQETDAPDSVTSDAVEFYVSIPYPSVSGDTTTWLYDVHTYPKNTLGGSGDKVVGEPVSNGLGTTVPWTITTLPLGSFDDGAPLQSYSILDTLDPRLTYTATPAPTLQYTTPGNPATTADVPGANYDIIPPAAAGGTLEVEFTPEGVTWSNTLPAGTFFTFSFSTTVTSVGDGDIKNAAYQNSGGDDVTLGNTYTLWGPAEILKHQTGDKSKTLKGAVFSVYDSLANGTCRAAASGLGDALEVSGETEFTSNGDGIVAIPGLYVGNETNGVTERIYCVVEIEAPAGYVTVDTPRAITVAAGETASMTLEVANSPVPGPTLPLTGSNGAVWFTVGGIALLAVAAGGFLMTRRSRVEE